MTRTAWMLSAFLLLVPGLALAQALDEAAVRGMLAQVDEATAARNVDAVARHISATARLTVEVTVNGQTQRISLSKPEYVDGLRQTWSTVDTYEYRRTNVQISIDGRRAVVTATIQESMTVQGQALTATSAETAVIEMVDGRPQLTSATARTQM